jgi:O-antigen/teichoic acid export membrane protein
MAADTPPTHPGRAFARSAHVMDTRRLLSSSALYGMADIAVVAVGGFLLLPLYTRSLSQAEFGHYVAVRANIDIVTYALQLGMPSAVARLYFDRRKTGDEHAYLSSVIWMFAVVLAVFAGVFSIWREPLWRLLSPDLPIQPALPFCVAIAAVGFLGAITVIWLRSEGKAVAVVGLQLGTAVVMAAVASGALLGLHMRLEGILLALLVSALVPALALPTLFGRRFQWGMRRSDVVLTLQFAMPVLVGYIAYFVLNRLSTVLLQHHAAAEELAVFGLAQQLSMIVAIACTSFGAALQPMVFNADAEHVNNHLLNAGRMLVLQMALVSAGVMLFARELVALVAPQQYASGLPALILLVVANFTNAFTLLSDTALLYHRRPKTSVAISVASAVVAAGLGFWLIPDHHIMGAALSVCGGFVFRMLLSQWMAMLLTGQSRFGAALTSLTAVGALGWIALQIQALPWSPMSLFAFKALLFVLATSSLYFIQRRS